MGSKAAMPEPTAGRPDIPKGYQIAQGDEGLLPWSYVDEHMAASHNYWVVTSRPDGRPHVAPVWGVWIGKAFYFSTDPSSRKGRNLAANPETIVHLESGDEVVILEGRTEVVSDPALLAAIDDAYHAKYGMRVLGFPGSAIYGLAVRKALAWREKQFGKTATRWLLDGR
jgi:hypothetical protein